MSDQGYAAAAYDDMPDLWDGFARLVRPALGISAFGANVMNLPPDYETKSHNEAGSGQEELYVGLAGSGWVVMGDRREPLDTGHAVKVEPQTDRVLASGPDGLRVLIIGGTPGEPYVPPDWSSGS